MSRQLIIIVGLATVFIARLGCVPELDLRTGPSRLVSSETTTMPIHDAGGDCLSEADIQIAFKNLTLGSPAAENTQQLLLTKGRNSQRCKSQIVTALIGAMDKP